MAIRREVVRKFGGDYTIPVLTVELGEDIGVGLLYTVDPTTGLAMKADSATAKHAVGVIPYSSLEGWGEAFQFNRPEILKAGERLDVFQFGILYAEELTTGNLGDVVYLGAEGKLTLTAPTTSGHLVQEVGYLANPKTGAVRLSIGKKGTANA